MPVPEIAMEAHQFNPTWLILLLSVIGPLLVFWRNSASRDDLEKKIRELRAEREAAAEQLRIEIKVAHNRAEDAINANLFTQREIAAYRERAASENLKQDHLKAVEDRFSDYIGNVEKRLTESIRDLKKSVDGYTTALIGRRQGDNSGGP